MTTTATTLTLVLLALAHLLPHVHAHSYLLRPIADRNPEWIAVCRIGGPSFQNDNKCPGPCYDTSGDWWVDRTGEPMVVRRGEEIPMVWARNQHTGGFVRLSLVPIKHRMSKGAHQRLAFRYACYDSGMHTCREDRCGTDLNGMAYKAMVEIPTTHPDGEYILGWAWYGATTYNEYGFGDYYSCARIIVRGGKKTKSYQPRFIPGEGIDKETCSSAVGRLGVCREEPCDTHYETERVPDEFRDGQKPAAIRDYWLN